MGPNSNTQETSAKAEGLAALLTAATSSIRSPGYGLEREDLQQGAALAILIAEQRMTNNMTLAYARVRGRGVVMDAVAERSAQYQREAPEEELANHAVTPATEHEMHRSSVKALLAQLISTLRPIDQQLLKAIYYDGKTYVQADAALDRNPEALNRRHRIVLETLRRSLDAKDLDLAHLTW